MFAHAMSSTTRGDREEQRQRRLRLGVRGALAAASVFERDLLRLELDHRLRAHACLQRRFDVVDDLAVDDVDR